MYLSLPYPMNVWRHHVLLKYPQWQSDLSLQLHVKNFFHPVVNKALNIKMIKLYLKHKIDFVIQTIIIYKYNMLCTAISLKIRNSNFENKCI